jgi:hypothetical protein
MGSSLEMNHVDDSVESTKDLTHLTWEVVTWAVFKDRGSSHNRMNAS